MKSSAYTFLKKIYATVYSTKETKNIQNSVNWGDLRRVVPISRSFGLDRGLPIDRYYIEKFLKERSRDIRGRVMEIGSADYTRKFGGNNVIKADVLHAVAGNPDATIIGDLATGKGVPPDTFDCVILTQTLHCIYDIRSAIRTCYSALKHDGVLLATIPGISQISRYDMDKWGDYWRITCLTAQKMFTEVFKPEKINISAFGNVLTAISFMHGLAAEELKTKELEYRDQDYELVITIKAQK